MPGYGLRVTSIVLGWGALALAGSLPGCVEAVPQDAIEAVENIDRDLMQLRAAEFSPNDYAQFAHQWMALKSRVQADEDLIRWPWEPNDLEIALRQLQKEGAHTVTRLTKERETLRHSAENKIAQVEDRSRMITLQVSGIDSRLVLGQKPVETDLLMKQAHAFYAQGQYDRSLDAADRAAQNLAAQAVLLSHELGRYANRDQIVGWQQMAKDTITWSRIHRASAIVVNKADRVLTLYRNGQKMVSYPVRLGFNGIREKRYQGDGATPEGRYRVSNKRGQGQTQFYRALVLDYPNEEDRRRYRIEQKTGQIPASRAIGGQIEIHGVENELMAQTLGCVMLDNPQMVLLFDRVEKGTPVTIVGALHEQNSVAQTLEILGVQRKET
ncbi:MAG: L,D-transpeptidase [Nitrospirota bacterium]|nr:L,D-transpeptidase [Nitrospirota bacterium]MDP3597142.1 L,D-transpeptidase [Nitrospirota bacterium]